MVICVKERYKNHYKTNCYKTNHYETKVRQRNTTIEIHMIIKIKIIKKPQKTNNFWYEMEHT